MMVDIDADDNGSIDFPEFLSFITSKNMDQSSNKIKETQSSILSPRDTSDRELRDKLQENLTNDVINI